MDDFDKKLTGILQAQFDGSEVELDPVGFGRFGGFLIWDGFAGREHIERQREVWAFLRSHLAPDEVRRVAAMLTLTPEEMASARAG